MTAEILTNFVEVNFKVQELIKEHEAVFDTLEVNKVWKIFLDSMKQDLTSDMIDSLAKYSITGQTGLSLLDFGVKGLRNLLFAINSNLDYNDDKIIKNYLLFKNSGKESLKDWYRDFLLNTIYNIESKSNLNLSSNLSDDFINEQYSNFISPYVRIFFAKYPSASSQETHEFIFNKIYEDVTELKK